MKFTDSTLVSRKSEGYRTTNVLSVAFNLHFCMNANRKKKVKEYLFFFLRIRNEIIFHILDYFAYSKWQYVR